MIAEVKDPAQIPKWAEPWFLLFNPDVEFHVAMTPEDLGKVGFDTLGQRWV